MNTKAIMVILALALFSCKEKNANIIEKTNENNLVENKVSRNYKIVQKAAQGWISGKGSFFDLLDEDMVWRVIGNAPYSGVYKGKKEFIEKAVIPINDFLSTSLQPEFIDINASEDIVWFQWKGTAKTIDGQDYINEYAWKLKLDDAGKIVQVDAFLDTYTLAKLVE
ncbi:nuclear transport factor 2 family protein [Aquimarina addita]|uniref:Nuclear transport factor 2 family protein n=1 Tax=Aquimarina addita TaxID=870485 RepID=A0ABP6USE2_9FLAO